MKNATVQVIIWRRIFVVHKIVKGIVILKNRDDKYDPPNPEQPLRPNCRCVVEAMDAVAIGVATKDSDKGADWWLRNYGVLPSSYIKEAELRALGWDRGDSPAKYIQGKMVTMGEYRNKNGHLPQASGRDWYEADINYYSGKRNRHRILWSNDGLIFVTYNHYRTFIEVA